MELKTNEEFATFRERIQELEKRETCRTAFLDKIGTDDRSYRNWTVGRYKNKADEEHAIIYYSMPSAAALCRIVNAYKKEIPTISIDWLLGVSKFKSPENEFIGRETGLSDEAITTLKVMKQSDAKYSSLVPNYESDLTILNQLLSTHHGLELSFILKGIQFYLQSEKYKIPVYHDGTYKNPDNRFPTPHYDIPDNHIDKISSVETGGETYLLHMANEDNMDSQVQIPLTESFIKTAAMKQIEDAIRQLIPPKQKEKKRRSAKRDKR